MTMIPNNLVREAVAALPAVFLLVVVFAGAYGLKTVFEAPAHQITAAVQASSIVSLTNAERVGGGLRALSQDPLLTQAAQMKANDMAQKGYYAHVSPSGQTPMHWLDAVGYKYTLVGENLVVDRNSAEEAVSAWLGSPGHRLNMFRPEFTQIGVGIAKGVYKDHETTFIVQLFATPKTVVAAPTKTPARPKPIVVPAKKPLPAKPTPAVAVKPKPIVIEPMAPTVVATTSATTTAPTTTRPRPIVLTTQEVPVWSSINNWRIGPDGDEAFWSGTFSDIVERLRN